jgi:hypothetical protein
MRGQSGPDPDRRWRGPTELVAGEDNSALPPDTFHAGKSGPFAHKVQRDAAHPSWLVLAFTRRLA